MDKQLSSDEFYAQVSIEVLRKARGSEQREFHTAVTRRLFRATDALLDIGCGLGEIIAALPEFNIMGIERCSRIASACVCDPKKIRVSDAASTGLSSDSFDGVLMLWAVLNEAYEDENVVAVLSEAKRLLRAEAQGIIDLPLIDDRYLQYHKTVVKNGLVELRVGGLPIFQKVISPLDLTRFYRACGIVEFDTTVIADCPWPYARIISVFKKTHQIT